jgi:hypothetical protein
VGASQSNRGIAKNTWDGKLVLRSEERLGRMVSKARGTDEGSWSGILLVEEKENRRGGGLTATNVPGRKNMVRRAMAFIAEESRLLSRAMSLL